MRYCASVLKLLFLNVNVAMASMETMEKYMEEWRAGKGEEWRNQVICSWNGVMERGKTQLDGGDLVFLVEELTEIDFAFMTHFKDVKYFMTTMESWTLMWEQYVETVERYMNNIVQRADLMVE